MPLDRVTTTAAIAVTTGVLTIKTRIHMNDAGAAAFAAVTAGQAYPTVTYGGSGSGYVDIVLNVTPDTPVDVTAEKMVYLGNYDQPGGYGVID